MNKNITMSNDIHGMPVERGSRLEIKREEWVINISQTLFDNGQEIKVVKHSSGYHISCSCKCLEEHDIKLKFIVEQLKDKLPDDYIEFLLVNSNEELFEPKLSDQRVKTIIKNTLGRGAQRGRQKRVYKKVVV